MAQPETIDAIPIPIPIKGVNFRDSRDKMPLDYCEWMLNWNPEPQSLKVRPAYVELGTAATTSGTILGLASYKDEKLFAYVQSGTASGDNEVQQFNLSTGSPTVVYTSGSSTPDEAYPIDFGGKLGFAVEALGVGNNESPYYNGTTWADWDMVGRVGTYHRGRLYVGDTDLSYGDIGAITVAAGTLAITDLYSRGTTTAWANVLTSQTSNSSEARLVCCSQQGEVLIFSGAYPDSPEWELVARLQGSPTPKRASSYSSNLSMQFGSDIIYISKVGLISVQKLLAQHGQEGDFITVGSLSETIQDHWTRLVSNLTEEQFARSSMTYWPEQNKVYILVNGFLDFDGTFTASGSASTMYVYNTISKGWGIHKLTANHAGLDVHHLTYCANNIYFATGRKVVQVDETSFADENLSDASTAAYGVQLYSAHNNFGSDRRRKQVVGFDSIVKTDFTHGKLGMRAASDFGRKESDNTSYVNYQDGYNNPFHRVGISGNYLQYRFSGTSDTASQDGYELLSMGVSVK